tara:strand:+ start:112 stop:324 length:213 start_codon:yes stop_codon:yes gene_type:complete
MSETNEVWGNKEGEYWPTCESDIEYIKKDECGGGEAEEEVDKCIQCKTAEVAWFGNKQVGNKCVACVYMV